MFLSQSQMIRIPFRTAQEIGSCQGDYAAGNTSLYRLSNVFLCLHLSSGCEHEPPVFLVFQCTWISIVHVKYLVQRHGIARRQTRDAVRSNYQMTALQFITFPRCAKTLILNPGLGFRQYRVTHTADSHLRQSDKYRRCTTESPFR